MPRPAVVTIKNNGNVTATGTFGLYESVDQTLDIADTVLAALTGRKINLRPGHSITLRVRFLAPSVAAGAYYLIAWTTSSTRPADGNSTNDVSTLATI